MVSLSTTHIGAVDVGHPTYDAGMTPGPRILLVEDDATLREAVGSRLRSEGYLVRSEADGAGILEAATTFGPDLAILDIRLPQGPSGLSIAKLLRDTRPIPLMFVTAADSVEDRLAGFEAGADDYLTKPFSTAELLARVRALLRRSGAFTTDRWQLDDLVVDRATHRVHRGTHNIDLTRIEFDLLVELVRLPDRVVSKTQLIASVWGFASYDDNLVEVHISALRRKLEEHGPRLIHTVRGSGYRLCATGD
jgi:two-component system, OmpR family, response regulator